MEELTQRIILATVVALTLATTVQARPHPAYRTEGDYYTDVSGRHIHRPMRADHKPAGATAHCRDGSWSFSEHHSGTCSHHGGVGEWE